MSSDVGNGHVATYIVQPICLASQSKCQPSMKWFLYQNQWCRRKRNDIYSLHNEGVRDVWTQNGIIVMSWPLFTLMGSTLENKVKPFDKIAVAKLQEPEHTLTTMMCSNKQQHTEKRFASP